MKNCIATKNQTDQVYTHDARSPITEAKKQVIMVAHEERNTITRIFTYRRGVNEVITKSDKGIVIKKEDRSANN